ncbi:hypothetical protein ACFX2B_010698 [Malus domestica]|uniref:F-box domain-containing protein n=1 Tax=Malus domestica TaxID=3750 RepID=A0A498IBU7_MALDO|nr:hypothetical protein DVH24_040198 [Malus domestica]
MKKHMRSTFLNPKYNPSDRDSVSSSALGGVSATQVQNAKSNSSAHPFKAHNSHTDTDTNNDSNRKSKSKSCGDSMIMYKWSEHLLKDLIEEIAKRLSLKDRVRMGAVCRSWSSAASNCSKQLTRTRNSSQELESACSVPKNTSNNACIVAAIAADRRMLLFCWLTDEKWTCQLNNKRICEIQFHDDGKLYALEMEDIRRVVVFDPQEVLADSNQSTEFKGKTLDVTVPDRIPYEMHSSTASLFSSSKGDIMLFWRDEPYTFIVLKLKFDDANGPPEWVKMNGSHYLKDEDIFVGRGGNTLVPRSKLDYYSPNSEEFLGLGGGNCIYFPSEVDVRKICVYNVAQGTLVKYPPTRRGPGALKPHRISVWFTPKPVVKDYTSTDPAPVVRECHPTSTDDCDEEDDEDATICFSNNFLYAMVQEDISYLVVFDPQEVLSSKNECRGKTLFV